jgi:hypothetical protein
MLNMTILDVAIGMIFVYLLLSLICSAANEMLEYLLKKRASDLERGIRELLTTETGTDPGNLVSRLYNHGLVSSLFVGTYEDSGIHSRWRNIWGTRLPSYIPARNFALTLMDLIQPGTHTAVSGAAGATPQPVLPAEAAAGAQPGPGAVGNSLTELRNAINTSPLLSQNARVRSALTSLVDAAGNDVGKARENIETWFNSGMDRVSGWYKRRTQIVIFTMGLFVAIAINADSITIAKRLSTDRPLRDSLVAASDAYAKANATASGDSDSARTPDAAQTPGCCPTTASSPAASPSPTPNPCWGSACRDNPDSPQCKLKKNQCEIEALGLPIGWTDQKGPGHRNVVSWLLGIIGDHGFGWLLTALAISLGAPFWFDLLNKFIVVRSTVKPKEKSPEETSKD